MGWYVLIYRSDQVRLAIVHPTCLNKRHRGCGVSLRKERVVPKAKRRHKGKELRARETQEAQRKADKEKFTWAEYRRRQVIVGVLIGLGVLVAATHLVEHAGFVSVLPKAFDGIYYPLGGALVIGGLMLIPA